jgi:hypothetical protein
MTLPFHNYSLLAGKTVYWDTSDNQDAYLENLKNPKTRNKLSELGFTDAQIEYQYNSHGFRTAEFDRQFNVACFGCSFTMGTGVYAKDSWPDQLQSLTGLQVANLGHAGSSNDTAFRLAAYYLPLLSPNYAVWLQTDMHRIELLEDNRSTSLNILAGDTQNPCANDYFIKTWFSSSSNQHLNLQKNTLAFKHLCNSLGITAIIIPREALNYSRSARDLQHPGADEYKKLAQHVQTIIVGPTKD